MGQLRMMIAMGVLALTGATALGIGASVSSTPSMMTRADYEAYMVAIATETQDLQSSCDSLRGADRHVCQAETRAREQVLQKFQLGPAIDQYEAIYRRVTQGSL